MIIVNDIDGCGLILHCKSGSSSIRHALNDDWRSVAEVGDRQDYMWWNVVRHPLPRFVSAWWSHTPDRFPVEWEAFVDWALETRTEAHIVPQVMDSPAVDSTIVRLEQIDDMAGIWRDMDIGVKTIHHLNASLPIDWRNQISSGYRLQEILKFCEPDMKAYGYHF